MNNSPSLENGDPEYQEVNESPEADSSLHLQSSSITSSVQMAATTVSALQKLSKSARKRAKKKANNLASAAKSGHRFVYEDEDDHDERLEDDKYEYERNMHDNDSDNDNNIFDASSIRMGVGSQLRDGISAARDSFSNVIVKDDIIERRNSSNGNRNLSRVDDDGFQEPSDDDF